MIKVVDGNQAAAFGAKLSKPDVIAAYPITPQTPLVEYVATMVARGELDAEMVEVESEHSALSVLHGAALAGARTFTATSSQGLSLMYEPYFRTSTLRLPVVMCIVTREMISPQSVWGGQQDAVTVRDAGWIQLYVENNQEVLDTVIQAYRLAEDKKVMLPVNVCLDGFYLSHMAEKVEIPEQDDVDRFLPPLKMDYIKLDPKEPISVDPLTPGGLLTHYRKKHMEGLENAKEVFEAVDRDFGEIFGRYYHGKIEPYRMDDAEIALVTMGSMSGTARVMVDKARERGVKVGFLKLKMFRPFPKEEFRELLEGIDVVGVIDRNVSFGFSSGTVFYELKSALMGHHEPLMASFIAGLGGMDITKGHVGTVIRFLEKIQQTKRVEKEVIWMDLEEEIWEKPLTR
jgi:pyruvate ferredoxin oxidoreductase alpha subunit/phenylglyoxylate dehydrogenase alpha subunit